MSEGEKQSSIHGADMGGMVLPTALVEQYPALADIDWAAMESKKTNIDPGELSDISDKSDSARFWGRPSFADTAMTDVDSDVGFDKVSSH